MTDSSGKHFEGNADNLTVSDFTENVLSRILYWLTHDVNKSGNNFH